MRAPNPADPEDAVTARAMARAAIAKWSNAALREKGLVGVHQGALG